jgi:hypothetical protein
MWTMKSKHLPSSEDDDNAGGDGVMLLQHGGPHRVDHTRGLDRLADHLDQPWIPSLACGEWRYGGGCAAARVCVEEMR